MHSSLGGGFGQAYCSACHQIATGGTSTGVTGAGTYDDEHAAVTVECLDCHEDEIGTVDDSWYSPGDDGVTNKGFINNVTEAHTNMTGEASASEGAWAVDYLAGNNEACIACHTNITVEVWLTSTAQTLNITANENIWGNWTVDFTVLP
jgi:cytochrome c1